MSLDEMMDAVRAVYPHARLEGVPTPGGYGWRIISPELALSRVWNTDEGAWEEAVERCERMGVQSGERT